MIGMSAISLITVSEDSWLAREHNRYREHNTRFVYHCEPKALIRIGLHSSQGLRFEENRFFFKQFNVTDIRIYRLRIRYEAINWLFIQPTISYIYMYLIIRWILTENICLNMTQIREIYFYNLTMIEVIGSVG